MQVRARWTLWILNSRKIFAGQTFSAKGAYAEIDYSKGALLFEISILRNIRIELNMLNSISREKRIPYLSIRMIKDWQDSR